MQSKGPYGKRPCREENSVSFSSPEGTSDCAKFSLYSKELDERHNIKDRLSKITRDIVTESKRIIFQLHRYTVLSTEEERTNLLKNAEQRLDGLRQKNFLDVSKELAAIDQNLFRIPVTYALQEFIEAWAFYKFIHSGELLEYREVIDGLRFDTVECIGSISHSDLQVNVSPADYLLGLSDVGGELMRFAINQVSAGNFESMQNTLTFMRAIYAIFTSFGSLVNDREWQKKVNVFEQSIVKVEKMSYSSKLRLMEIPEGMRQDLKGKLPSCNSEA